MPELSGLFSRWWKQILLIVFLSLAISAAILYLQPLQYMSVTTAVPGNALSADKSRVFNNNIEALYSDVGLPDELDVILGTAQLDTIYLAVADQFNLFDHYKLAKDDGEARQKSARRLKKNSRVIKSDYGELKVKVWDTDRNLAPQMANALMDKLQQIHQSLYNNNNRNILASLHHAAEIGQKKLDSLYTDSAKDNDLSLTRRKAQLEQLQEYEKLINQYDLIIHTSPASLLVAEMARPSLWPDRPKRMEILIATGILSLFFAFLVALVLERNKRKA